MKQTQDIGFPQSDSIWKNMIISALFKQIGAATFESQMAFLQRLTNSEVPSPSDCMPTTKAGWRELATLANEGPMETELYYRWAAAIVQAKREQDQVPPPVCRRLDLGDDWNSQEMRAA